MTDRAAPAAPDELLARIDFLLARDVGDYPVEVDEVLALCRTRIAANAALAARCGELEQDAERYRWLRARWDADTDEDIERHTDAMNADDPDAAIDAALASQAAETK